MRSRVFSLLLVVCCAVGVVACVPDAVEWPPLVSVDAAASVDDGLTGDGLEADSDIATTDAVVPTHPCTDDVDCNDGNDCTLDRCEVGGACVFVPADGSCSDGQGCVVVGHCYSGICEMATALCDDGNQCTSDTCAAGGCSHSDVEAPCQDADACMVGEKCSNGSCMGL